MTEPDDPFTDVLPVPVTPAMREQLAAEAVTTGYTIEEVAQHLLRWGLQELAYERAEQEKRKRRPPTRLHAVPSKIVPPREPN